mmetsp:Transcript_21353/g.59673  ORF Transcript_21353/g.59673 Transcript_21353/m.59673 type:complete len:227 (+) Transcript_21353:583-1263(+)
MCSSQRYLSPFNGSRLSLTPTPTPIPLPQQGMSTIWTSGITAPASTASPPAAADSTAWDIGLSTPDGLIRIRFRNGAYASVKAITDLLAQLNVPQVTPDASGSLDSIARPSEADPLRPPQSGLRFYRAEPVPKQWGDPAWPDNYFGGRWGPPYALLQGSLNPDDGKAKLAGGFSDRSQQAHPVSHATDILLRQRAGTGGAHVRGAGVFAVGSSTSPLTLLRCDFSK